MSEVKNSLRDKKVGYISLSIILSIFLYFFLVFDSINKYNGVNLLLYLFSFIILLYALLSIKKNNINSYNIFLVFYFFALFLNTFNVSSKQFLKTPEDLYFFLLSPFIVAFILYFFEHSKITLIKFKNFIKFDVNIIYIILLFIYISLKLYIGMKVGFRITNYDDISVIESGTKYTIPGISGIAAISQWLLVILIPYVKKRYIVVAVMSVIILSGILNVKRGDIMRVFIFILLYSVFIKIQSQQFNRKRFFQIIIFMGLIIFAFVQFGEYRNQARGGTEGVIIEYLGSRVDSVPLSWIYSYLSFNFEVLKLYYDIPPSYEITHLTELISANLDREALGLETTISGFNAGTFIEQYILDYGYFYFLELVWLPLIAGFLVYISRKLNFLGLYLYIATLMSFMVFGDYLLNRSMFMSMIAAIIIFPFLKLDTTIGIKRRRLQYDYFN